VREWLRTDLRPLLDDMLLSARATHRGYFDPRAIRAMVDEHLSRRADRTPHLWALLMLELWFREVVDAPTLAARAES
jgi:asparagine synthase (glutamine-hydrolysing)